MAWAKMRIARALEDMNRERPQETIGTGIPAHSETFGRILSEYATHRMFAVATATAHIADQPPCGRPVHCLTAPGSPAPTLQQFPDEVKPRFR